MEFGTQVQVRGLGDALGGERKLHRSLQPCVRERRESLDPYHQQTQEDAGATLRSAHHVPRGSPQAPERGHGSAGTFWTPHSERHHAGALEGVLLLPTGPGIDRS